MSKTQLTYLMRISWKLQARLSVLADIATKVWGTHYHIHKKFRESFNLFDKENDNRIHVKDLGTVLRSLGLHPTEAELTDLLSTIETEGTGKMEFAEFCGVLARVIKDSDPETELTEAFKVFDKDGSGSISNAELRRIMTTYGETLNEEEVDEMIRDADTDGDGHVDYAEFVQIVVAEMRKTDTYTDT